MRSDRHQDGGAGRDGDAAEPAAARGESPGQEESPERHAARYRLDVTGGPQRGACERVETDTARTLGSGLDCDIVLLDPRVDERALVLDTDADGALVIEVRGGELRRDGVPLEGEGPHPHVDGASYRIGSTSFTLTAEASASGRSAAGADVATGAAASGSAAKGAAPGIATGGKENGDEGVDVWLPKLLFGFAALLCVAIGVSYALHRSSAPAEMPAAATLEGATASASSADLGRRLAEAGFETVRVEDDGADAVPRVSGYVQSRRRFNELRRVLRETRPRADIDVHVQSDIVEGVRDVYRTNGVEAAVESIGPGEVRVVTAELEPRDPAFMRTAAMEDVAGLATLEARNVPPPVTPPEPLEPPRPPGVEKPGKRVVAIVRGAPSYVVTEDDSRYFVGSLLPTGHTIAAIDDESVMLERQGQKTRLEF